MLSIASGHTALAVLPVGGKALFRYAEVVADARKDLPRLARPDDTARRRRGDRWSTT